LLTSKRNNKPGEQEWLVQYCQEVLKTEHYDFMIFGHRHLPLDIKLNEQSRYINLGEWVFVRTYAVFENGDVDLRYFEKKD